MYLVPALYKMSRLIKLDDTIKELVLPAEYKQAIQDLDRKSSVKLINTHGPHAQLAGMGSPKANSQYLTCHLSTH
jgi:hypothetical protein